MKYLIFFLFFIFNIALSDTKNTEDDYFFIESRTELDELFGKGVAFDGGFVTSHYRRFINQENFKNKVLKMGFKINYEKFSRGLAIKGNEDPKLMRFVLRR